MAVVTPEPITPELPEIPETLSEDDEILLKAENYIIEHGWCQHSFQNTNGLVCILGAINVAATGKPAGPFSTSEQVMLQELNIRLFQGVFEKSMMLLTPARVRIIMSQWNDTRSRTKEDVIALLREARGQNSENR